MNTLFNSLHFIVIPFISWSQLTSDYEMESRWLMIVPSVELRQWVSLIPWNTFFLIILEMLSGFFFFWVFSCISKLDWFLPHFQNITQRTWGGLLVAVNFQMSLFPQSIFRIIKLFCFYDPTKEQSEQAHFTDGNTERSLTWSKLQSGQGRKMTARSSVC